MKRMPKPALRCAGGRLRLTVCAAPGKEGDSAAPRLDSLLQQLTAMRLDLMHGIIPRAERIGLTKDDLEYVLRQLYDAIAVGQDIAACLRQSVDAATTPGAWRSEDTPAKVREVS